MKKHLAIELSRHGATFVSLIDAQIIAQQSIVFHGFNPQVAKDVLNQAFTDHSFLSSEFDEVTLAWNTNKSTLVPNSIFAESDAVSIFQLCFGNNTDTNEIDYNRISEASVVNVFEIPTWVKSYFVIKFPRIVLQHVGTHGLRSTMDSNAFKLKATLIVNEGYFSLSMVKHNQLQFYSFFDAQSAEDVIYHLMFTLQQKEFLSENGNIELAPGMGKSEGDLNTIQAGLSKIVELSGFKVNLVPDFIPKAQQLCV
jgi:hypothetical protein